MRVLIADDSRTSVAVIDKHIRQMGHESLVARNGDEALRLYEEECPDLVLLDVVMPGRSGLDIARAMRAARPEEWIPIIFLSSRIADQDIADGIDAGADDYLTKPVNPIVLRAKIMAMQRIATMRHELAEANRRLARLSSRDPLTELANRRAFDDFLRRQWNIAVRRGDRPLTLIMLDVDFFKRYNDRYGHPAGDECLRRIGAVLAANEQRGTDIAARYGGEEFVLAAPETPFTGGVTIARRLQEQITALELPHEDTGVTGEAVSVSIGLAAVTPRAGLSPQDLIRAADDALYRAKRQGRNRIEAVSLDDRESPSPTQITGDDGSA